MGLFDSILSGYKKVDKAVSRAEDRAGRKLLEITVPKKTRKDAKELAHFLDRFAGMIATNAPNTESAPSFIHETLAPFREAKRNPTPWNIYAAGGSAMAVFPWGTKLHAGPDEWDSSRIPGGRIRNMGSQENPRYHWVPPGSDIPDLRTYLNVNMQNQEQSYVDMFRRTDPAPGGVVNDMLDPLLNRYTQYGSQINAYPVNTKVAGTLLGARARDKNMISDYTTDLAQNLVEQKMRDVADLSKLEKENPGAGRHIAQSLRSMMEGDQQTPRDIMGVFKGYERWMNRKRGEGERPEFGPDYRLPDWGQRDQIIPLLEKALNPDEWRSTTERARFETTPGSEGGLFAHEHQAASMHTQAEWDDLSHMDRIHAAERVRDGLPARRDSFERLRNGARHWWTDFHPGEDPFDSQYPSDQAIIMQEFQRHQLQRTTDAVMEAIGPSGHVDLSRRTPAQDDVTSRAIRMAEAHPGYHRMTDPERRAEARRIRGQLAHADEGGFVTRETFEWEEARRAHNDRDPLEWDDLTHTEQRESVERARLGLPYLESDYLYRRDEAARLDPRYTVNQFLALTPMQQMERTAEFFRRRGSER